MMNNQIQELGDLDPLSKCSKLEFLALHGNPVCLKKHYRLYLIHRLPALRVLDFKKIKIKERQEAKQLFTGSTGKRLETELGVKSKTFVPGGELGANGDQNGQARGGQNQQQNRKKLSPAEIQNIKVAISRARSLEEVERLNQMLRSGNIPTH